MKKSLLYTIGIITSIIITASPVYAGKAGAAIGGFIGGTIVGSALTAPRESYRETVIVQQPTESSNSIIRRLRRENEELREDNRYLQDENRTLSKENNQIKLDTINAEHEIERLDSKNSKLRKENMQLECDIARLKKELTNKNDLVEKELAIK